LGLFSHFVQQLQVPRQRTAQPTALVVPTLTLPASTERAARKVDAARSALERRAEKEGFWLHPRCAQESGAADVKPLKREHQGGVDEVDV
jgi:hypothetical protein